MQIGYVGLGSMGGALAARLQGSHDLIVFDRSPTAAEVMTRQGATVAASLADLAAACEVVFLCLPTSDHVEEALSVISPVADDVAVVFRPLLPAGLYELLGDLQFRLVDVPEEEYPTLGCNVLAVRPGVVVVAEGNPATRRAMEAAGVEVHAIPLREVGENGSGGVTCLTRPVLRA